MQQYADASGMRMQDQ